LKVYLIMAMITNLGLSLVSDLMTTDVITVEEYDTMAKVDHIFTDHNIHHIPVLSKNKVIGIVSKTDYLKVLHGISLFTNKRKDEFNKALLEACVIKDVMTSKIATVKASDTLEYVMGFFRENMFHALPVVNEDRELVGIITTYDLLNFAYRRD